MSTCSAFRTSMYSFDSRAAVSCLVNLVYHFATTVTNSSYEARRVIDVFVETEKPGSARHSLSYTARDPFQRVKVASDSATNRPMFAASRSVQANTCAAMSFKRRSRNWSVENRAEPWACSSSQNSEQNRASAGDRHARGNMQCCSSADIASLSAAADVAGNHSSLLARIPSRTDLTRAPCTTASARSRVPNCPNRSFSLRLRAMAAGVRSGSVSRAACADVMRVCANS
mmetsp:Transcript_27272/g.68851  ORF Transcript_27272/g.68851 Transcript_27272/m.68851 type:complete len:229 (+) Transcript_27272:1436-2122(+)